MQNKKNKNKKNHTMEPRMIESRNKKAGYCTWAIAIHVHGLSHGCSCVFSVPQDLLWSCNCHASSPDYHATCKLRQKTQRTQIKLVTKSHADM